MGSEMCIRDSMWAADSLSGEKWDARNLNKLGTDAGEIYMEAAIRTLEYL